MDIKFSILIVALINFILAGFCLARTKKTQKNLSFISLILACGIWAIAIYFYEHPIFFSSLVWIKIVYSIVGMILIETFFWFMLVFPIQRIQSIKLPLVLYNLAGLIGMYFLWFTDLWVKDVVQKSWGVHTVLGPLYWSYVSIWWFGFMFFGIYHLMKNYRESKGFERLQLKHILLGVSLFVPLIVIADMIHPLMTGETRYFWLSPMSLLIFVGFTTYAITRYRLMDIRVVVKKGTIGFFTIFTLLLFCILPLLLVLNFVTKAALVGFGAVLFVFALFLYQPLRNFYEKKANKYFFTELYHTEKVLRDISSKIATYIEIEKLNQTISETIKSTLNPERIAIFLYDLETKQFKLKEAINFEEKEIKEDDLLIEYQNKTKGVLVLPEIDQMITKEIQQKEKENLEQLIEDFKKRDIELSLPLIVEGKLRGLILLSKKVSNDPYSAEDILLLTTLSEQASLAISNALFYEEVRKRKEDLEKFYKLTVGRELRMIELKKKIKELEEKMKK